MRIGEDNHRQSQSEQISHRLVIFAQRSAISWPRAAIYVKKRGYDRQVLFSAIRQRTI